MVVVRITILRMSKRPMAATDQVVKLIVGAGLASPSPPVGPALGSKGVKSMDFCKVCTMRTEEQRDRRERDKRKNDSLNWEFSSHDKSMRKKKMG